jgi:hypothetical protein
MSAINIEKNIPITPRLKVASELGTAIRSLEVGDSFLIGKKKLSSVSGIAKWAGIKIASRVVDKEQVRVWRTA